MTMVRCAVAAMVLGAALNAEAEPEKLHSGTPIKVLHVTGGCCHDYAAQSGLIPALIKARGDFKVDVIGPDWKAAKVKLAKADWAAGYDVIVYNICDAHNTDTALIHNITKVHIEDATPAVMIHCALHSFHWNLGSDKKKYEGEEWVKVLGITSANHGPKAAITVKPVLKEHPIMKGLPATWTTPGGELYNSHEVLPTATPLAMGDNGNAKQGPQVCIWVNQCEQARVFGTSLGHHNTTMQEPVYGDMLVRGLLWACEKLK